MTIRRPLLISFSGLDGAGKSTQIENLRERLAAAGLKVKLLTYWDDVVVLTRYREAFVHTVYKSEKGVGAPNKPVNRRDKNVRAWYLTIARHALYLLDAIHLRLVVHNALKSGNDAVIVDRYVYDELANLPLERPMTAAEFHAGRPSSLTAIKRKCLDCSGMSKSEVRNCAFNDCALYPFRQGKNPNRTYSPEERARRAEFLASLKTSPSLTENPVSIGDPRAKSSGTGLQQPPPPIIENSTG